MSKEVTTYKSKKKRTPNKRDRNNRERPNTMFSSTPFYCHVVLKL